MTEKTLASYKQGSFKIKLLEITYWEYDPDIIGTEFNKLEKYYIIIKNRKRLLNTKWLSQAYKKLAELITSNLLQTKISF